MKKTFFLVLALLVPLATFASVKQLSPATKIWLERQQSQSQQIDDTTTEAFVSFSSPDALDKLERKGAKVNAVFDGFCTVSIPANAVGEASDIHGVNMIDISHRVHLLTDSVSSSTHARMVNEGVNLPQSYTGKGVVLGVVDTGIDFNHRAFLDSNLKNRIARVYMPHDNTGKPVEGLPGSEFAGDDILNLKYDAKETHGTHTTGIAGGSIVNAYRGMAPDAELVLCALGDELTEVNVVNGVQYIAQYAASVGKPCVINLSLGNHDGPHDGNGFMSRAFDEIAQRYRNVIIVLAAGNEGYAPLYMRKTISGSQTLATILSDSEAEADAWSNNTKPFGVKILLYNSNNPAIVYTTDCLKADTTFNLNTNDYFAQAVRSGKLSVSFGKNDVTGHTRIYLTSDMRMKSPYKIGLEYQADEEIDLRVWECSQASSFQSYGMKGFTDGSDKCSISDMATGHYTISVGSCVNRNFHTTCYGDKVRDTYAAIGSISSFSSYGVDVNGVSHPYIVAPGQAVISSVNSYLSEPSLCAMKEFDASGRMCYWGVSSGTSMASPCVAGIVALWQEANPHLTIEQVKSIMAASADKSTNAVGIRFGNGRIDAYQGILQALSSGVDDIGLATHDIQMVANGDAYAFVSSTDSPIRVLVYAMNGADVASSAGVGIVNLNIGHLGRGVYIVNAMGVKGSQVFKILKK